MVHADLVAEVSGHIEGVPVSCINITAVPAGEFERIVGRPVVEVINVNRVAWTGAGVGA